MQGLLLISGREWLDFYGFHPELSPFLLRVEPDVDYQAKIAECLLQLLEEIERIEGQVKRVRHKLVSEVATTTDVRWD